MMILVPVGRAETTTHTGHVGTQWFVETFTSFLSCVNGMLRAVNTNLPISATTVLGTVQLSILTETLSPIYMNRTGGCCATSMMTDTL